MVFKMSNMQVFSYFNSEEKRHFSEKHFQQADHSLTPLKTAYLK